MHLPATDTQWASRLIDTLENDILPITIDGVAGGNKIFGAALLLKSDQSTYLAATNNELENPLWHGEMHLLKLYFEIPENERTPIGQLLFVSTHEPCSLCLSAITWAGFDNFYYFFSHEDSRDDFAIPHDLKILKEVFNLGPGQYRRRNAFWQSFSIIDIINSLDENNHKALTLRAKNIKARYQKLSEQYQSGKSENSIPLN
ncbi:MAG: nucleoside deaminase [Granulosicoccaceae bacterium]